MDIIFSPLFYINGNPHVGHRLNIQIINVIERLITIFGSNVIKYTGTDEHGDKIINAVEKSNTNYNEYIKTMRDKFSKISGDTFYKYHTNSSYHRDYIKYLYIYLKSIGIIYEGKYIGQYCTREERYITEAEEENYPHKEFLVHRSETGLFLKLDSEITNSLINSIDLIIINDHYKSEAINIMKSGKDIFISRFIKHDAMISIHDKEDLSFYVWFDAINYYNNLLAYYSKKTVSATIVIGCDIIRFHLSMLLHISYYINRGHIPFRFFIHGLISINDEKLSKSLNNFQQIDQLSNKYNDLFYASVISNGVCGKIEVNESICINYLQSLKNNIRNLYSRLIGLNTLYSKVVLKQYHLIYLIQDNDLNKVNLYITEIYNIRKNLQINKIYNILLSLANLANNLITKNKLWEYDANKEILILKCHVIMENMIIIEYILGHDVKLILSKLNIKDINMSIMYNQQFSINNLTNKDVLL